MNKAILKGHVGQDPETRVFENGKKVANFSLATNEHYKNKNGEKVTNTTWHNIVAFSTFAEIVEKYVKKGKELLIVGRIENRSYEAKDGTKKYISEIRVTELEMIASGENKSHEQNQQAAPAEHVNNESYGSSNLSADFEDDLPF